MGISCGDGQWERNPPLGVPDPRGLPGRGAAAPRPGALAPPENPAEGPVKGAVGGLSIGLRGAESQVRFLAD